MEIIDFSDEYKDSIKVLNYEWLEEFFVVEESDKMALSNPREEIIDKGGYIYYAKLGNDIVGTVSLLKETDEEFTLAKMAVKSDIQGYGIGTQLIEHVLNVAKKKM